MRILDFNTIILDLDYTVWYGCKDKFWAKKLVSPIKTKQNMIIDKNGDFITLYEGVEYFLKYLTKHNKNIGYITRGGFDMTPVSQQPPVECLFYFGISEYFKFNNVVTSMNYKKSQFFRNNGNTLYIDDNENELIDIKNNFPDVVTLNRNQFKNWKDLQWIEI